MIRSLIYLVLAAATAALLISIAEQVTREQRVRNQNLHATRMLSEVLPVGPYDQPPGAYQILLQDADLLGSDQPLPAWPVERDGAMVAIVISALAPDGYVAPIPLLVGIERDGTVVAVRATGHRETPGLGDKIDIDKSAWMQQFAGQRDIQPGQFDHISGATITSRAVTRAVRNTLEYYRNNQSRLTKAAAD